MKIFINPGHSPNGEPDPGAVSKGIQECDVVLKVGELVKGYLDAVGYETMLMQSDSLRDVVDKANDWAELFVSIHCNSFSSSQACGAETWHCVGSTKGERLARCIQSQIVSSVPVYNRGVKVAVPGVNGLYVLTNTDMPAVLVELAFLSNDFDWSLLTDDSYLDKFAAAIARGVTDYQQAIYAD